MSEESNWDTYAQMPTPEPTPRERELGAQVLGLVAQVASLTAEVEALNKVKDGAYFERNQVVACLARVLDIFGVVVGTQRTAIEGWSEDWHGCVYMELITGQVSWHYHDSQAYLFESLPLYISDWDGHDTPEKYRRVNALYQPAALHHNHEARSDAASAE